MAENEKVDTEYKFVRVQTQISPIVYKSMKEVMDKLGIHNDSTYAQMAIKHFNDTQLKK